MKTMKRKKIELLRKSHRQPTIDFIRIREGAQIPARATRDAAGYDLSSAESCTVPSGGRVLVHTGVSVRIPRHYHIEIRPRSGLALRHGMKVLNTPGPVDADYRGDLMVILFNTGEEAFAIEPGDRIAQAVVVRHADVVWREIDDFDDFGTTDRGNRGFGSTGI